MCFAWNLSNEFVNATSRMLISFSTPAAFCLRLQSLTSPFLSELCILWMHFIVSFCSVVVGLSATENFAISFVMLII